MSALSILILATCSTWMSHAQTVFKRVAEANVTLPCHHQLHLMGPASLDIEWLLQNSESDPKVVITYAGDRIYPDFIKEQKGRVSFASNFRAGDASLEISFLQPSDAGLYTCKVKNAGRYEWNSITLKVLEKPSKPKCWKEGEMSEGKEITLQCDSASGTKPITYQWKRIIDEEGKTGSLPPMTRINFSNPAQIMMNLTRLDSGSYQCTAFNEAGQDSCIVQVTVQYARNLGIIAGAACGAIAVPILVFMTVWLTIRRKEKNKYEEESPNEIREDAEAPKARLVKPGSSTSGSRSSHSGSSSTRSTANSASRSQQTLSTEATPHITPTQHSQVHTDSREIEPKKINHTNLVKTEVTSAMVPAQSRAFQTV
ncbi:CXADR-like membrane protein [Paroedura picta]|uniref:CXADR-like membrane protein n=1 Tax=Paroedura picta TaxID=143630 RepID=UPI004056BEE2